MNILYFRLIDTKKLESERGDNIGVGCRGVACMAVVWHGGIGSNLGDSVFVLERHDDKESTGPPIWGTRGGCLYYI